MAQLDNPFVNEPPSDKRSEIPCAFAERLMTGEIVIMTAIKAPNTKSTPRLIKVRRVSVRWFDQRCIITSPVSVMTLMVSMTKF
ncbi:hypothetical protein KDA14_02525 [Candidatus Saccharibacteria bacterium]|nr:hypothetical protein [Candidatus Saccharibacteria bacterium]